jgi:NAD(P)-dependent dehydrogenase (short-subunit alcohol dehydrogenase family)
VANLGTGGSSGIGRAAVEYFCENGCKAVSLDISDLKEPVPKGVSFIKCNVSKWEDIRKGFEEVRKVHGRVDIVCANAGNNDKEDLIRNDDLEPNWDTLDVTLKGIMMSNFS